MKYQIKAPPRHEGQEIVWSSPARWKWLAAGRRWGKTRLGTLKVMASAARGGRAWWVAPTYKMAEVGWRPIRRMASQIPKTEVREVNRRVILPSGGLIEVRSADDPDSLRGEGLDFVVMDECAYIQERAWTEALSPALADREGGALFISTPKGRNWFWRGYEAAKNSKRSQAFQFTTFDNPHLPPAELERIQAAYRDGKIADRIYRQEYLAEFVDDAGGVFRRVTEAATSERLEEPEDGARYSIGVDWGKLNDFTVLTVLDIESGSVVYLDRFNQIDYRVQVDRLQALAERFKPLEIVAERNSMGEPIVETLYSLDLPVRSFQTTAASKNRAIEALALAFEKGDIEILPDPVLLDELQAYELERLPSGQVRYGAPAGLHDDCVMSLALAWSSVSDGGMGAVVL